MAHLTGRFQHEKNENIDEYFREIGVPYIARKMISASSPEMVISEDNGIWKIQTISLLGTTEIVFKLDEEYEEFMPGGLLKTTTTLEDNKLISVSSAADGTKIKRIYEFSDSHCVINLLHEKSGQSAKRIFRRIVKIN